MHRNLSAAKSAKQDEFYTQYVDIQKEVEAYLEYTPDTFRGKAVYCNCDDPFESNFFKYFAANFNKLGLKKLVTTSYDGSPIAGAQLPFGEYDEGNGKRPKPKAIAVEIEEVKDVTGDGAIGIEDVTLFLKQNPHTRKPLAGGGDFRSAECVELLTQADIVVTNPPFSLFREYVAQLVEHGKKFLIIGNVQAITYKEIFPLIKADKMWMGVTIHSGDREFRVPDHYPLNAAGSRVDENGVKYIRVKGVRWYTNLDHGSRHEELKLMSMADNLRYNKKLNGDAYHQYDNYGAIEVPFTDAIPSDYDGVMGVPITFLDKYNPEQFEILGATQRGCHDLVPDTRKYDDYWEVRQDGSETGSSGGKTNENANLLGNDGRKNYFINSEGRIIQSAYQRIFIRHRARPARRTTK
ncbi:MAG: adenine-specific methyltransferase EcoRI family protein [Acidobacteriota bacterium]